MKIIDLLNKIAKGEETPKKIKWGVHKFEWIVYEYKAKGEFQEPTLLEYLSQAPSMLNEEIEIIEDKIPEKLSFILHSDNIAEIPSNEMLMNKINEILDYLEEENE